MGTMGGLGDLMSSPAYYPVQFDLERNTLRFVPMTRETYQSSVFLDHRTVHLNQPSLTVRIDDLLLAGSILRKPETPCHYIFHTTFCCSTLLSRYFEILPEYLVLREPGILTHLALHPARGSAKWLDALQIVNLLLARIYSPGQRVVIKPHEPVNSIAGLLLRNPAATATCVSTDLRSFLVSVLKLAERRNWVRRRIQGIYPADVQAAGLGSVETGALGDAQAAAYLWIVNRALFTRMSEESFGSRVLLLDGGGIANSPEAALQAVNRVAQLGMEEATLAALLAHPSANTYSKNPAQVYSSSDREAELLTLAASWKDEVEAGLAWAGSRCPSLTPAGHSVASVGPL